MVVEKPATAKKNFRWKCMNERVYKLTQLACSLSEWVHLQIKKYYKTENERKGNEHLSLSFPCYSYSSHNNFILIYSLSKNIYTCVFYEIKRILPAQSTFTLQPEEESVRNIVLSHNKIALQSFALVVVVCVVVRTRPDTTHAFFSDYIVRTRRQRQRERA